MRKLLYALLFTIISTNQAAFSLADYVHGMPTITRSRALPDNSAVEFPARVVKVQCRKAVSGDKIGPVIECTPQEFLYEVRNNPMKLFIKITGTHCEENKIPKFLIGKGTDGKIISLETKPDSFDYNIINDVAIVVGDRFNAEQLPRLLVQCNTTQTSQILPFYNPAEAFYAFCENTGSYQNKRLHIDTPGKFSPSITYGTIRGVDDNRHLEINEAIIGYLSKPEKRDRIEEAVHIGFIPNGSGHAMTEIMDVLLMKEGVIPLHASVYDRFINASISSFEEFVLTGFSSLSEEAKEQKIQDFRKFLRLLDTKPTSM